VRDGGFGVKMSILENMGGVGWLLMIFGGTLFLLGLFFTFGGQIPLLGKLPGDIIIDCEGLYLYLPITTCILISLILTIIFWILTYSHR